MKPCAFAISAALPDAVVRVVDAVRVAAEPLPRQPAHGRRPGEAVLVGRGELEQEEGRRERGKEHLKGKECRELICIGSDIFPFRKKQMVASH